VQKERQYFMLRHRLKSVLSAGPDEEAWNSSQSDEVFMYFFLDPAGSCTFISFYGCVRHDNFSIPRDSINDVQLIFLTPGFVRDTPHGESNFTFLQESAFWNTVHGKWFLQTW
jgi:hypothetical protein